MWYKTYTRLIQDATMNRCEECGDYVDGAKCDGCGWLNPRGTPKSTSPRQGAALLAKLPQHKPNPPEKAVAPSAEPLPPNLPAKAAFDRKAYQREYMKGYITEYMRRYRASKREQRNG